MQTFATLFSSLCIMGLVSGSPVAYLSARNTCGSAPTASSSQTPIQQPADIETASACQSACNTNNQCQSFVFGMVDNTIKCMLYSVPASQVPKQSSQNLVAYDKACSSVPAVTPTSSNPTGANTSQGTTQNGSGSGNGNGNQQSQQGQQGQQDGSTPAGQKLTIRDTCGATPAGSNANQAPLSQPVNVESATDCRTKCQADANCKSFEFGRENGASVCRLFSVTATSVPAPTNGQSFQVYDVGCSM